LQIINLEIVEFFHVKRHLNSKANELANKGVTLEQGILFQDEGSISFKPLPEKFHI